MNVNSRLLPKFIALLIVIIVVQSGEMRTKASILNESTKIERSNETESVINKGESDYYSDVDDEFEKQVESIRSTQNWVNIIICFSSSIEITMIIFCHIKVTW